MLHTRARFAAAVILTAAAWAATPVAPASAAGCQTADGVTVVVDFHELGGGVQTGCVADGGGDIAADLFVAAGFPLTYVQRQPGFVCRVSGKPADDPCVSTPPTDAYWGLFWSDGKSGSWSYATTGVGGQRVPAGGYVALSWNGSATRSAPGITPAPHPGASPTPTQAPTHPSSSAPPSAHPSQQQSGSPSATATSGSESASPTEKPKPGDKKARSKEPSPSDEPSEPTESPSESPDDALPTAAEPADPDGGLPPWVAPVVVVALFGGAGAAAVVRRRRGASGP